MIKKECLSSVLETVNNVGGTLILLVDEESVDYVLVTILSKVWPAVI